MADEGGLSKETFLGIADASGLDVSDESHMDELYAFVQGILRDLKTIGELDLSDVEPAMTFIPLKE